MKTRVGPWLVFGAVATGLSLLLILRFQPASMPNETNSAAPAANPPSKTERSLRENDSTAAASNDPRTARVLIGGREWQVSPNARGEYQRLVVTPAASIEASVPFPNARPGEAISVQSEDGGMLREEAANGRVSVDAHRRANVSFSASVGDGIQRVTLRRGGERRVLEFWVGEEPPVLVRR